jgi:antitoxin YefM
MFSQECCFEVRKYVHLFVLLNVQLERQMTAMRYKQDIQPLSEFRANTAAFVRQVRETGRPLILTQRGRGAAVLLDIQEYERLLERSELLEELSVAEAQITAGQGIGHETAKRTALSRVRQ